MRRLDHRRQLIEYFKKNLTKGYTADSLRFALVDQGYSRAAVDDAIKEANKELAEKAPVLKEKPVIKYEVYDEKNNPIQVDPFTPWEKVKNFFRGNRY